MFSDPGYYYLNQAAAEHWNSLDSEQKGHFIGEEVVPLAVPGAVGIVAKEVQSANLVGKTGEGITALTSAEKVAEIEQEINQLHGHIQKFSEVLGKPMEPVYANVSDGPGRRRNLPELPPKDDNLFAMSKSNEGESLPKKAADGREKEPMPEKKLVSEAFESQLIKATENLKPILANTILK